jgi:glycosyltransferase involved in cell wall biosynthesis
MRRHILILVENLSVPFDRRVWQESLALVGAGYEVTVICPTGAKQDREREAVIEGVRILRYPLRAATGGPLGYLREYTLALWHTLCLAIKIRCAGRVDIVHACNPPDLLFLIALALRPGGTRFVFDHHDLVPELFVSRFPGGGQVLYRLTKFVERLTFAAADAVISTNESYRRVAIERGKMAADRVTVVRSAPDLSRFVRREPDESLRRGKPYLLAYLGVMGPQDGVDYALRALQLLRDDIGRDDIHCIFMGTGDAFDEMVALSEQLGLTDMVEFPGRVSDEFVQRCLSTADVCLSPDPLNALNDVSTMNKLVEYMAMGRPLVSFDLVEARVSAGEAAVYVPGNDELAFATAIDALLRDPERRRRMGESGRNRVEQELSWEVSRRALVQFYDQCFAREQSRNKAASKLAWYAGRAAAMSPREISWRARCLVEGLAGRDGLREQTDARMLASSTPDWGALAEVFRDGTGRSVLLDQDRADQISLERPTEVKSLLVEAEKLLAGERTYFGCPIVNVGSPVDWNYDPVTDYRWPAFAGSRINHRMAGSDPKWIWELNRLQHLPVLAQAWLFTGDQRFAEIAFDHLDSWLDQNPIGTGIAWRGAFEVGIRAISVAVALQGLRHSPAMTTQRYRDVVRMLDASARYCWYGRSRFSSANNHLIGELTGLITVHSLLPELGVPASLRGEAIDSLAAEAERQILPDGAGAEQSITYQMFTAELLSLVVALLRLRGDHVPPQLIAALDRSTKYLVGLVGSDDPAPRYGDDDDSFALRLGSEPKRTVRQHLGIVAAITGSDAAARYGETTLTAAWIAAALGTHIGEIGTGVGRCEATAGVYAPDGGLVVLRNGRDRLTMDVGPLGYLSIAAHGHADALAVTLSAQGRELIVDPGTASYCGKPEWRAVHRGTRAHPTVCVDGVDQSEIGGTFYWRRHAATTVRSVDLERGVVDAEHDGYRRLQDPVVHRRWLIAPPGDETVAVVDLLDGRSVHDVAVSWPLHPELEVTPNSNGHMVIRDGLPVLQLCYAATSPVEAEQVRADPDSQLGWWSDRLEARTPAWLVGARCRTTLPVAILSVLCTSDGAVIAEPKLVRDGAMLVASWSEQGVRRGFAIDSGGDDTVATIVAAPAVSLMGES